MEQPTMYYFGPLNDLGHHIRSEDGEMIMLMHAGIPWGHEIDGGLAPKGCEVEGDALLHKKGGWTAISFWDRTIDKRPGSNSAYLAEGDFTFEQMVEMARSRFAERWNRMAFEVRLVVL